MTPINQRAETVLKLLIDGLDKPGDAKTVQTSTAYMAVAVECIAPRQYSVAHYGEQNGDLMRDPEMIFWHGPDDRFYPIYFRNDYAGFERESITFDYDDRGVARPTGVHPRAQRADAMFAGNWMRNIATQQRLHPATLVTETTVRTEVKL